MSFTIEQVVSAASIIPVLVIEKVEHAVPLANALVNGGLKVLEITLRTDAALAAISEIRAALPEAIVGAGTIITPADYDSAINAGSMFLVSPGTSPELLEKAKQGTVPMLPGVATPSEAMNLYSQGFTHLKFFPAEAAGGIPMLKSIGGPLPQLKFCPTGGINAVKAKEYLKLNNVVCLGGSWMAPANLIANENWGEIEKLAAEAVAAVS